MTILIGVLTFGVAGWTAVAVYAVGVVALAGCSLLLSKISGRVREDLAKAVHSEVLAESWWL